MPALARLLLASEAVDRSQLFPRGQPILLDRHVQLGRRIDDVLSFGVGVEA